MNAFRFNQVSIIGSAKVKSVEQKKLCNELGYNLSQKGYSIVCGGLGGVMKEVCYGFQQYENRVGRTIGILPSYDANTANPFIDVAIPTGLDVGRNQLVVSSGFAVISLGGGAGTLSEIAIASQINKSIILMKGSGGWSDQLSNEYLDERKNSKIYHADTTEAALNFLKIIKNNYSDKTGLINSQNKR